MVWQLVAYGITQAVGWNICINRKYAHHCYSLNFRTHCLYECRKDCCEDGAFACLEVVCLLTLDTLLLCL